MTKYNELRHFNRGTADEALVNRQLDHHAAGFREVEIVRSIHGFSVRHASGIDNFALLRSGRGQSYEDAVAFCEAWVAEDPSHRSWSKGFGCPE